jgi:hypothetical protein
MPWKHKVLKILENRYFWYFGGSYVLEEMVYQSFRGMYSVIHQGLLRTAVTPTPTNQYGQIRQAEENTVF